MEPTHVHEHEIRRTTVLFRALFRLEAQRARPAGGVRRVERVLVGGERAEEGGVVLVEEVVDGVELGGAVALGAVDVAVEGWVGHVEGGFPHVWEFCLGV